MQAPFWTQPLKNLSLTSSSVLDEEARKGWSKSIINIYYYSALVHENARIAAYHTFRKFTATLLKGLPIYSENRVGSSLCINFFILSFAGNLATFPAVLSLCLHKVLFVKWKFFMLSKTRPLGLEDLEKILFWTRRTVQLNGWQFKGSPDILSFNTCSDN